MLHPDFPVVDGLYQLTSDWTINLPEKFNRRVENEDLVLWRPGLTMWVAVWDGEPEETAEQRMSSLMDLINPSAYDLKQESDGSTLRFGYRLREKSEDRRVPAFYAFVVAASGHIELAIYFDREEDMRIAENLWRSIEPSP